MSKNNENRNFAEGVALIIHVVGIEGLLKDLGICPEDEPAAEEGKAPATGEHSNGSGDCGETDCKNVELSPRAGHTSDKEVAGDATATCYERETRKEVYQSWHKELTDIMERICKAENDGEIHEALNRLEQFIKANSSDPQIGTYASNLTGAIKGVRMHDLPRKNLIEMIQHMLERINKMIEAEEAEERKQRNVGILKRLGEQIVAHADELADILDMEKILG